MAQIAAKGRVVISGRHRAICQFSPRAVSMTSHRNSNTWSRTIVGLEGKRFRTGCLTTMDGRFLRLVSQASIPVGMKGKSFAKFGVAPATIPSDTVGASRTSACNY